MKHPSTPKVTLAHVLLKKRSADVLCKSFGLITGRKIWPLAGKSGVWFQQTALARPRLMKCFPKRPPLHICKSHLLLSSTCESLVFSALCNIIFHKCGRTSVTFVNRHFASFSLNVMSSSPLACSRLGRQPARLAVLRLKATMSLSWYFTEQPTLQIAGLVPQM